MSICCYGFIGSSYHIHTHIYIYTVPPFQGSEIHIDTWWCLNLLETKVVPFFPLKILVNNPTKCLTRMCFAMGVLQHANPLNPLITSPL